MFFHSRGPFPYPLSFMFLFYSVLIHKATIYLFCSSRVFRRIIRNPEISWRITRVVSLGFASWINGNQPRTSIRGHGTFLRCMWGCPRVRLRFTYFTYKVNILGAGWIGPHTDYSYYLLLLRWNGETMCAFTL
jgi:hypothetical protein